MTATTQRGDPADVSPHLLEHGHETSDVPPRGVVYAVIGLFSALILSGLLLLAMFHFFADAESRPAVSPLRETELVPPGPRLEADPTRDRAAIEAEAKARLDRFGWSDRQAGLARIPIDEAMRLLADRGWPDPEEGSRP